MFPRGLIKLAALPQSARFSRELRDLLPRLPLSCVRSERFFWTVTRRDPRGKLAGQRMKTRFTERLVPPSTDQAERDPQLVTRHNKVKCQSHKRQETEKRNQDHDQNPSDTQFHTGMMLRGHSGMGTKMGPLREGSQGGFQDLLYPPLTVDLF